MKRSVVWRLATMFAMQSVIWGLYIAGLSSQASLAAYTAAARWFGPSSVRYTGSLEFATDGHHYEVVYWCTPTSLCAGGCVLLAAANWRTRVYVAAVSVLAMCSSLLLMSNFTASLWIRREGLVWEWSHIPGTVVIYLAAFIICARLGLSGNARQDVRAQRMSDK